MLGAKCSMYNVVFVKVLQRGSYLGQKSDYAGFLAPSIENILLQISQGTCHWNLKPENIQSFTMVANQSKQKGLYLALFNAKLINKQQRTAHKFIKVNKITEILRALWLVNIVTQPMFYCTGEHMVLDMAEPRENQSTQNNSALSSAGISITRISFHLTYTWKFGGNVIFALSFVAKILRRFRLHLCSERHFELFQCFCTVYRGRISD